MGDLPKTNVVRLDRQGSRLFVTLDDPHTRNALSEAMVADLEAVLAATREDRSLRVMVIRGAGGMFCAGGNLKGAIGSTAPAAGAPDPVRDENIRGGRLFHALNSHPSTVVALVDGPAMGGGFGLVCCADVVITTDRARFALSETSLGLAPAQIAPLVVARIGLPAARRLALTGARFDGAAAAALGLSDHHCANLTDAETVLDRVLLDVGRCGPEANARTKALMLHVAGVLRTDLIEQAADVFTACLRSDEGREGVAAFVEKRRPTWAETI